MGRLLLVFISAMIRRWHQLLRYIASALWSHAIAEENSGVRFSLTPRTLPTSFSARMLRWVFVEPGAQICGNGELCLAPRIPYSPRSVVERRSRRH